MERDMEQMRLFAKVDVHNTASQKIRSTCGFIQEGLR